MKKIYGFAFAAAVMALASCSNENEPVVNPTPEPAVEGGYMAINLAAPAGTRATVSYKDGNSYEQTANSATFMFFDEDGKQTQIPQNVLLKWYDGTEEDAPTKPNGVELISQAVVVVAGRDNGTSSNPAKEPKEVIVVLNDKNLNQFIGLNKAEVMNHVATAVTTGETGKEPEELLCGIVRGEDGKITSGSFIMTNSSYIDGTTTVNGTSLTYTDEEGTVQSYVKKNRADAAKNPVKIYVERLAARVDIVEDGENFVINPTEGLQVDNGTMTLTPMLTGIQIANVPDKEFFVKNVDTWVSSLHQPGMWRSNWAVMPMNGEDPAYELINKSYNSAIVGFKGKGSLNGLTFYTSENTTDNDKDAEGKELPISKKTSLLLTAQLTSDGTTPVSLVRWAGRYFTPEGFQTEALNLLYEYKIATYDTSEPAKVTGVRDLNFDGKEDITLQYITPAEHTAAWQPAADSGEEAILQYETYLKATQTEIANLVKVGKDASGDVTYTAATVADINKDLKAKENRCWYWDQGRCYYFVEIQSGNTETGYDRGVVRNNVYEITLKSLSGLGVPIYNPGEIIIPQTPVDPLFYIGADIRMLQWRVVAQDANFENGDY